MRPRIGASNGGFPITIVGHGFSSSTSNFVGSLKVRFTPRQTNSSAQRRRRKRSEMDDVIVSSLTDSMVWANNQIKFVAPKFDGDAVYGIMVCI